MNNNFRREGSTDALPIGYLLHWYELLEVVGRGGYGITYLALDRNLQRKVAIKEYLPLDFACRDATDTVHPVTNNHKELFDWGLHRFLVEARTLAKFNHPAIIRVVSVFEHNNTAYMVMEYEEGDDLAIAYMERAPFSERDLLDLFIPIVEGLALVHDAGFIHRDIKPSNIYVRSDGSPVLLDFGSARQTVGSQTRALTSLVTAGYAPFEQYNESEDAQGAWTDIYGLGATLYFCMTGAKPADAMERGSALLKNKNDIYQPLSRMADLPYSEAMKLAVDHALRFHAEERPGSVLEWADMLTGRVQVAPLPAVSQTDTATTADSQDIDAVVDDTVVRGQAEHNTSNTGHPADEDDDDSTRVYYRPPHQSSNDKTDSQVTDNSSGDASAPNTGKMINSAEPDLPVDRAKGAAARVNTAEDPTTIGSLPQSTTGKPSPAQSAAPAQTAFTEAHKESPAKVSLIAQWQRQLGAMVQKALAGASYAAGKLKVFFASRTKTQKLAAAGTGLVVVFFMAVGLLIGAGNDAAPTKTLKVKAGETGSATASPVTQSADSPVNNQDHESTIEQATQDLVQGLLAQAKLDIANSRILEPANDSAVYRYKKVLTLQADNAEARQGLAALVNRYENLINATIDEQSWQQAKQQIQELKQITDDPQVIKPLQARLKDYEKQLKTVARHLDQADRYMKRNHLTRPKSANALALYTKVLEIDPDNKRANKGVTKIVAKLSDFLRDQIKSGRISSAEKTYKKIESINPGASVLAEAESKLSAIVERRKSIVTLLKSAERDFIRGNLTRPAGKNAYDRYRKALRISPSNKEAKEGIDRIYGYYVSSYYQYLNEARFKKAQDIVSTLRRIDYGKKQIVILRRMIQDEKAAAKQEPETIKLMLSQLAKGLKNKDLSAVDHLSSFKHKNRQFVKQLFNKYATYSVKVMQTDHDLKSHQAKARINFSDLVAEDDTSEATKKKEIKVDVKVSRNEDKEWKITW
ncbi:MAG: protein kinase [Gammaproteobacteria bacterium]|jgi:serine/threonine protein kinase/tetratricopeptide (TPR) repeat protein